MILRILLIAVAIFIMINVLRLDFTEGTIPARAEIAEQDPCEEIDGTSSILITSIEGDTIESLFALYPDPKTSFINRLEKFYSLNPHLELQEIVSGDKIRLPITHISDEKCVEFVP